jgi:hypothetical protein
MTVWALPCTVSKNFFQPGGDYIGTKYRAGRDQIEPGRDQAHQDQVGTS